jgi:hypothetical protein
MTSYEQFADRCKARHDFGDMIQVRYAHTDGEFYDTWVSGEEALGRLQSQAAEQRIRGLRRLDWDQVRKAAEALPEEARRKAQRSFKDMLADGVEKAIGGNPIGDSLTFAISGRDSDEASTEAEEQYWQVLLKWDDFRDIVLQLAWIQLEGSFPDTGTELEAGDWQ